MTNNSILCAVKNQKGSTWHRWEPHIHAPGTVLNNLYGPNDWDQYLTLIENSNPRIEALGITDYFVLDSYQKVLAYKAQGRLPDVQFIFPNVELRFANSTPRESAINGHLLISPDDPNHMAEAKRFFSRLYFETSFDKYACTNEDLIKLGRIHDSTTIEDHKALSIGANQFKITFSNLTDVFKGSEWARGNILLGMAVGTGDGTGGYSRDASFAVTRKVMDASANVMFTGQPEQRLFWLGKGSVPKNQIEAEWNGLKACIHGSDAHDLSKVGKPDHDRFTWIKGDLNFESLKQISLEPEFRVLVGPQPPGTGIDSNIMSSLKVNNASWIVPSEIVLNPGLVAIIGARGSGKTALADLIAAGGNAAQDQFSSSSFLKRAEEYLGNVSIKLNWQAGESEERPIQQNNTEDIFNNQRVQYLSQQFVENLCSSEGVTDQLMQEIERVIFAAHEEFDRLGYEDFQAFLHAKASVPRSYKNEQEQIILECATEFSREYSKKLALESLENEKTTKSRSIVVDKDSLQRLIVPAQQERMQFYSQVSAALTTVKEKLTGLKMQHEKLLGLKQQIDIGRNQTFPNYHQKLKNQYPQVLSVYDWEGFKVDFVSDIDALINQKIAEVLTAIRTVEGTSPALVMPYSQESLLPENVLLTDFTFSLLNNEFKRLSHFIGIDNENGKKFNTLNQKIVRDEAELTKLQIAIDDSIAADQKIQEIIRRRRAAYQELFSGIVKEEMILNELYHPLQSYLKDSQGSLGKMSFEVRRIADIETWANHGEELLDLRKVGKFRGHGELLKIAEQDLKQVWQTGTAEQVAAAFQQFMTDNSTAFQQQCPVDKEDKVRYANWLDQFGKWLFNTSHISIRYAVKYDEVDIQQLSPGTRGIVLLLLYLAIDNEDTRPLIIDQPEENLDPKSIFDELVPLFRTAKHRRQIIIVTHNANLVVNSDADQVIIASSGPHRNRQLPVLNYQSGGLENSEIRQKVCSILEGGEAAFKERAKRLRVSLFT
jgi:hypothetical protein